MKTSEAKQLVESTFTQEFSESQFTTFIRNLLPEIKDPSTRTVPNAQIPKGFREHVKHYTRIGTYQDSNNDVIDVVIVQLKDVGSLERARSRQRNIMAHYLKERSKDAVLAAYISDDPADWRFSFVKLAYKTKVEESGRVRVKKEFTPAQRFSFLVGEHEPNHTAQQQLGELLAKQEKPSLADIEAAFNIESVTKAFFSDYKELFLEIKENLDAVADKDPAVKAEFKKCGVDTANFAKKLLGQIVFLYFLQKKGWLGVQEGAKWGSGDKQFLYHVFQKYQDVNFFDAVLEPFFYEALAVERPGDLYPSLQCKVPFLNGGLFEPLHGYDWQKTHVTLGNEVFKKVFEVFNLYNFTVREDEPLEKEVAVDPEMLGKVFENLLEVNDRKGKGAFYTPREIVHYMCQESLINYLYTALNEGPTTYEKAGDDQLNLIGNAGKTGQLDIHVPQDQPKMISKEDIELFIKEGEASAARDEALENGDLKSEEFGLPECIRRHAKTIDRALAQVKICDPAIGSGAFPVGMMNEIVRARTVLTPFIANKTLRDAYTFKWHCIENSLYGVDIDPSAIEIAKLRLWLSLVVDEDSYAHIRPLPNLDYRIVCGNSLLGVDIKDKFFQFNNIQDLEKEKNTYFSTTSSKNKQVIRQKIKNLINLITNGKEIFDFQIYFSEVFSHKRGFDVVIGNPPYVSTKGRNATDKNALKEVYGFADDLYSHFYFRGTELLKPNGYLIYISSKTFWTIQTKKNLRQHLLKFEISDLIDTGNPFDALVDTCILGLKNNSKNNYQIKVLDAQNDFSNPSIFIEDIDLFRDSVNHVFFIPTESNLIVYEKYNAIVKKLMDTWWEKIETSRDIARYKKELDQYRDSLKPGDITLIGLVTEGGQGLATANNGKYVGVLEGTTYAARTHQTRPIKLLSAIQTYKIKELREIKTKDNAINFLRGMSENEIRFLFDDLKKKYGRDIFGQGYLFRIVSKSEIANVDELSENQKMNGIKGERTFVPYDKGDREGNRWYLRTPYYIDWSMDNVSFLKSNSGKKGEGMPVVRNPQFYFREGFCWSDIHTLLIKCRLKTNGVHDVKSMSLFSLMEDIFPEYYLIALLNSTFISNYDHNFINSTQTFQINDARQIPIPVPAEKQKMEIRQIFQKAIEIKEQQFNREITSAKANRLLSDIQQELDLVVYKLYGFTTEEVKILKREKAQLYD